MNMYDPYAVQNAAWSSNPVLQQLAAINPAVKNILNPAIGQYGENYFNTIQDQNRIGYGQSEGFQGMEWNPQQAATGFGLFSDPGVMSGLTGQIQGLGDANLNAAWDQALQYNQGMYDKNKVGGLLAGEIPWQVMVALGVFGAGAAGLLGAAGATGGAAGGGLVGAGLEGAALGGGAATGAGPGLGAGEGLVGWDALGNAAAGGAGEVGSLAGEAGWGVTQGAGEAMDVWDLMGDPSMYGLDSGYSMGADAWSFGPGSFADDAWMYGPGNIGDVGVTGWNNDMASLLGTGSTSWTDYLKNGSSILKALGGGSSGSDGGLLGGLTGGLLGGDTNNLLGKTLGLAPILGGLAYGYNMAEPDLGRLESLYDQYNPQASLGLYDYNTEMGRNQLYSNLGRRGISGSSFANNDITNYNTVRDMGRNSTLNQGIGTAAGIANQIAALEAVGNRNKTDLIGRGLYSIGTLFGGK